MTSAGGDRLSVADERRIDEVCERYEAAARGGDALEIDGLVEGVEPRLRGRLRDELLALQAELCEAGAPSPPVPLPGRRLGSYCILHKIGEGGMGTVFEAVQETTRRRVAVKVVRSDLGSEQVRRRFEREARLLAHLHHPGIAQIFDAGVDETSDPSRPTPYLVMELLRGLPLIEHAERFGLDRRARLEMVRRVCGAVQHAHDQGIVHRDLKPANILVVDTGSSDSSRGDASASLAGTPKVLDFGVARVVEGGLDASLETQTGQIVGTMAYMSPEQLDGAAGVDGRADVYALGVILFELLAGELPHDIRGMTMAAAVSLLRQAEPRRLGRIDPRLRGDVEIIVGKALEKRPEQRYQTASALAADLQRHLDDVPIEARHPDAFDRLAKFARRNRGLVGGILTAAVGLVVALVLVSVFAFQQGRLREAADDARLEADRRERLSAATSEFLHDMLMKGDLTRGGGVTRQTTVYEMLENAAARIDGAFPDEPLSRAAVREALGASFLSQAAHDEAEVQLRTALETWRRHAPDDLLRIARLETGLGQALEAAGRLDEAEVLLRGALATRRALVPSRPQDVSASLNNLALLLERRGHLDEALRLHRENIQLIEQNEGPRSEVYATALNNVAATYEQLGEESAAREHYQRCLDLRRELLTAPHPHLANVLHNLGLLDLRERRYEDAEPLLREALDMRTALFDVDHPSLASTWAALGSLLSARGQLDEAIAMQQRALDAVRTRLGEPHVDTAMIAVNLAINFGNAGDPARMREMIAGALETLREQLGPRHATTLWALGHLAGAEARLGNAAGALVLRGEQLQALRESLGEHSSTAESLISLGEVEASVGNGERAVGLYREAVEMFAGVRGEGAFSTQRARFFLARQLEAMGRGAEAMVVLDALRPHLAGLGEAGAALREEEARLRARIGAGRD